MVLSYYFSKISKFYLFLTIKHYATRISFNLVKKVCNKPCNHVEIHGTYVVQTRMRHGTVTRYGQGVRDTTSILVCPSVFRTVHGVSDVSNTALFLGVRAFQHGTYPHIYWLSIKV